jgi:ABC-type dipeptide/oligopeptide/nickel transport system permease component
MLPVKMIARRQLWVFQVAFGVVTITFFTDRVFNDDPAELYAPQEASDALRAQLHLLSHDGSFRDSQEVSLLPGRRSHRCSEAVFRESWVALS